MANANPSPETRFKPGQSGNPGGKTAEQLRIDREAADFAARIRHKMLSSLAGKLDQGVDPLNFIDQAALKLFKDSEDRAWGSPKSTSELSGPDGSAIPVTAVEFVVTDPAKDENTGEGS